MTAWWRHETEILSAPLALSFGSHPHKATILASQCFSTNMTWTLADSRRSIEPHSPSQLPYILELSLSSFVSITPHRTSKDAWRKHWMKNVSDFIDIFVQTHTTFINLHGCFVHFGRVLQMINWKWMENNICWHWGLLTETGRLWELNKHTLSPIQTDVVQLARNIQLHRSWLHEKCHGTPTS